MKTGTQSRTYPVEVNGIPVLKLTISVSAIKEMMPALQALGFGEMELPNKIIVILDQARDALDGSIEGLIISNLEE